MNLKRSQFTSQRLSLEIPIDLYDVYAERAAKFGKSAETEMVKHLEKCQNYNAVEGIYLDDTQRNELSKIAGKLIRTPTDLLDWAKQMVSLKVGTVEIPLGQQLITRLESRRFGKTWADFMRALVPEKLEEHVGLR